MAANSTFTGPRLKIDRAKHHLDELKAEITRFYATHPYQDSIVRDETTGEVVVSVIVNNTIPVIFSTIAGDVVHNLRSSLDQLVCASVRRVGAAVTRDHCFPIADTEARFAKNVEKKLANAHPTAVKLIMRLRPHGEGNRLFWVLSELDNMDKHDDLIPVAEGVAVAFGLMDRIGFFVRPDSEGKPALVTGSSPLAARLPGAQPVPLTAGLQEVHRVDAEKAKFFDDFTATVNMTFGNARAVPHEPFFGVLESLVKLADKTVTMFERYVN